MWCYLHFCVKLVPYVLQDLYRRQQLLNPVSL